ncbi:hypothetical protein [Leifsonia sp. Leaf264]|uniref:hypothetical protein n=1 Tax=Leifsonia sp. Leaf264 TaxID=1736314 RepID=UPI0006F5FFCB|nr:hypothetical protein [Leifsonia sp. Leaf264]KQO98814.1 hypothetical protein ASF30_12185 [Leifsonia sp. Leaf264]
MRSPIFAVAAAALITLSLAGCASSGVSQEAVDAARTNQNIPQTLMDDDAIRGLIQVGCDEAEDGTEQPTWKAMLYRTAPELGSDSVARYTAIAGMQVACPKYAAEY